MHTFEYFNALAMIANERTPWWWHLECAETCRRLTNVSFIHLVVCLTTGPKPLPKRLTVKQLPSYRTRSATLPLSKPLPTTTRGHYTICCKKFQSCAPEDGQKIARNTLRWSWRSINLLLLHLVDFIYYFTYNDDAWSNTNQILHISNTLYSLLCKRCCLMH